MHEQNFADVLVDEDRAVAVLLLQLRRDVGDRPAYTRLAKRRRGHQEHHRLVAQEVYEDNDVQKGLREPLREFGLRTEPWLFTFTGDGRVAAQLEGSFGNGAFRRAVEAALDG